MLEVPRIFISHTTHDERDRALAHKLARGLRDRGSEVWIAPDDIPIGMEWEPSVVAAIMAKCSHYLVIISAASARSEWVLREMALAEKRRAVDAAFAILPLVVGKAESYQGHDFIKKFQHVPYYNEFSQQLDALARSLHLRPDVPRRFAELTDRFVGREYVFDAIGDFVGHNNSGYLTVVGDPGEGKSSIVAEFVRRTGTVAYFNIRAEGNNRAAQCLNSISSQVSARYGLACDALSLRPEELGAGWENLLARVSVQLFDRERLIIAIDALDEVDATGHPVGANVLCLPRLLPKGIYFVLTRRRASVLLFSQSPQEVLDLSDYRTQGESDIRTYIQQAVTRLQLQPWINRQGIDSTTFTDVLTDKSELNFMYLYYVLREIERGTYQGLDLQSLPHGLRGYYEDHWERMGMRATPVPRDKIRVIYVMAEARRAISRSMISGFARQDPIRVQEILDEWRQFFHEQAIEGDTFYSIYHTSFLEFLHDKEIVRAAGETIEGINAAIAEYLLRKLNHGPIDQV